MKIAKWVILCLCFSIAGFVASEQSSPKSAGLTSIPKIESFEQVEQILRELASAIDRTHRSLLGDVDAINRDEIPAIEATIAGLDLDVDFDFPLMRNVVFSKPANVITWTAGEIEYAGTTYTVSSGAAADSTYIAVQLDLEDLAEPTTLIATKTPTYSIGDNRWFFCYKDTAHNLYPAMQSGIIHGGLVQANTITANQIASSTITSSQISVIDASVISDVAPVTADQAAGGGYAKLGLTSSGNVARAIVGDDIDFGTISPTSAGLYMTDAYLGFYGGGNPYSAANWNAFIKHDGDFYFGGDGDNYVSWDGSDFTVACEKGFIGSSTDYFDITSGILQVKTSGLAYYTYIANGAITVRDATAGGGNVLCNMDYNGIDLYGGLALQLKDDNDNNGIILEVDGTQSVEFWVETSSSSHYIVYSDLSSSYLLGGFTVEDCTINECIIGSGTGGTAQGTLRVNGNVLECYLNGGWRTAATGD